MEHQADCSPEVGAVLKRRVVFLMCMALAGVLFIALPCEGARAAESKMEAEALTLSGYKVFVKENAAASGGKEVAFSTNGAASSGFDGPASQLVLRARGTECQGDPQLNVYVDGVLEGTVSVASNTFADYPVALSGLTSGTHTLRISFENNYNVPYLCDRNAFLDYYVLTHSGDPVLVGAAKIGNCKGKADEATGQLLNSIPGTLFTAGDNAYPDGTAANFDECYGPGWGRHKDRTRPSPGNHDYFTPGASGYFGYFGEAAGDPSKGYYSYDLGEWHVIALNSLCGQVGGCEATSPMLTWLRQDLAANPTACTVAYFNHALFSSGRHGNAA
jgi:hypothetical protein